MGELGLPSLVGPALQFRTMRTPSVKALAALGGIAIGAAVGSVAAFAAIGSDEGTPAVQVEQISDTASTTTTLSPSTTTTMLATSTTAAASAPGSDGPSAPDQPATLEERVGVVERKTDELDTRLDAIENEQPTSQPTPTPTPTAAPGIPPRPTPVTPTTGNYGR